MVELVVWLRAQLDEEEQQAFAAGDTLGGELMLRWRALGSGVEVYGMRRPVNEPPVVTNRLMEGMPGYEVERARALHIASQDPDRVMGEVAAKRQALDHYERVRQHAASGDEAYVLAEGAVAQQIKFMALPYADRPGYREEWRP